MTSHKESSMMQCASSFDEEEMFLKHRERKGKPWYEAD
jgi:hypothetical protein